ncbi:MAG: enoyl-CoA hydratase/isomerase family protein [Ottowia sp.]|uniref:enoyl-CoA hydratase/isomerase family protein n=1 Tax=Ottowia sp. TaxID=1898956 RepID=UPI0039E35617
MNTPDIICHQHDGLFEITLHRPERLNALTPGMAQALLGAVRQAQADPAVGALLIEGEGRAFCAGKDRDAPGSAAFVASLQQLADALVNGGKPSVAAVQGWAVGAGLELALNCDLVIASDDARFKLPEAQLGLPGTGGVHALLPRLVGLGRAKALLWLGDEFDARRACEWGLVWDVAPRPELPERARAYARRLLATDPQALSHVKALVHGAALPDFGTTLDGEAGCETPR